MSLSTKISLLCLLFLSACTSNKTTINNDLKKYFDAQKVDGTFSLWNNQDGTITICNMALDTQRILPASTFKIVNTLIGVQSGKITDEKMVIKYKGIPSGNPEWDKDLTLKEAFRVSAVPYFQEVARRIGRDTMQLWIDSLQYGNKNISGPIDSFWLNNHLKISPDEQLGLLYKLYFDKLPFQKYAQQMVRDIMLREDNTLYKFSYKTGLGADEKGMAVGWLVGWIEENRHVYFFSTLIKGGTSIMDYKTTALQITKNILTELGYFKGQK